MGYIFDTALNDERSRPGGAWFFRNDRYLRYDWAQNLVDAGPSPLTEWGLPAPFDSGVDAALNSRGWGMRTHFFRGSQYAFHSAPDDKVYGPYPLGDWLPSNFASGIDTALNGQGDSMGKAYFFKGDQYITYDWFNVQIVGGPSPIADWNLTGAFAKGVHATLQGDGPAAGWAYFFRGPQYVKYSWSDGQVVGPLHLSDFNLTGGIGSSAV
ncbi:hypothetical protein [Streptomyces sp. NPDC090798]|uniref:hypothetical protein n=1 Tax=Streptomyces sp. NPDC090798 TaxID=3365968 RepID=UPI00380A4E25